MKKETIDKEIRPPFLMKFIAAIVLATLFFLLGFLLSYFVLENKYAQINEDQFDLKYSLLKFETEELLLENSCDSFSPTFFSEEMDSMGKSLEILEKRKGRDNSLIAEQKDRYFLLEARHLLYVLNHNANCLNDFNTVLFFYSTDKDQQQESERVGSILESIKNNNPDVMIYSFDYNFDTSLLTILKEKYNISSANSIVINEEKTLNEIKDVSTLQKSLN